MTLVLGGVGIGCSSVALTRVMESLLLASPRGLYHVAFTSLLLE